VWPPRCVVGRRPGPGAPVEGFFWLPAFFSMGDVPPSTPTQRRGVEGSIRGGGSQPWLVKPASVQNLHPRAANCISSFPRECPYTRAHIHTRTHTRTHTYSSAHPPTHLLESSPLRGSPCHPPQIKRFYPEWSTPLISDRLKDFVWQCTRQAQGPPPPPSLPPARRPLAGTPTSGPPAPNSWTTSSSPPTSARSEGGGGEGGDRKAIDAYRRHSFLPSVNCLLVTICSTNFDKEPFELTSIKSPSPHL